MQLAAGVRGGQGHPLYSPCLLPGMPSPTWASAAAPNQTPHSRPRLLLVFTAEEFFSNSDLTTSFLPLLPTMLKPPSGFQVDTGLEPAAFPPNSVLILFPFLPNLLLNFNYLINLF